MVPRNGRRLLSAPSTTGSRRTGRRGSRQWGAGWARSPPRSGYVASHSVELISDSPRTGLSLGPFPSSRSRSSRCPRRRTLLGSWHGGSDRGAFSRSDGRLAADDTQYFATKHDSRPQGSTPCFTFWVVARAMPNSASLARFGQCYFETDPSLGSKPPIHFSAFCCGSRRTQTVTRSSSAHWSLCPSPWALRFVLRGGRR